LPKAQTGVFINRPTGTRNLALAATQLGSRAVAVAGRCREPRRIFDRLYTEVDAAGKGLDVVVANAGSTQGRREPLARSPRTDLDAPA